MIDVFDRLRRAERAYIEGDCRKTIRNLEAALRGAREMGALQKLPNWVQVGTTVEWLGEGPNLPYTVVSVDRKSRGWSFMGEYRVGSHLFEMEFCQAAGKRLWRRYRG